MAVAVDRAETSHGAVSDTLSGAAVSGLRAVDVLAYTAGGIDSDVRGAAAARLHPWRRVPGAPYC